MVAAVVLLLFEMTRWLVRLQKGLEKAIEREIILYWGMWTERQQAWMGKRYVAVVDGGGSGWRGVRRDARLVI